MAAKLAATVSLNLQLEPGANFTEMVSGLVRSEYR